MRAMVPVLGKSSALFLQRCSHRLTGLNQTCEANPQGAVLNEKRLQGQQE